MEERRHMEHAGRDQSQGKRGARYIRELCDEVRRPDPFGGWILVDEVLKFVTRKHGDRLRAALRRGISLRRADLLPRAKRGV